VSARDVSRYVADLIRGRRPRPFRATPEDLGELRAAIMLRSATPGADEPAEEFVAGLGRRLAAELADDPPPAKKTRRRVVRDASLVAASAAAGVAGGAALTASDTSTEQEAAPTLAPTDGTWHAVARDLPEGHVVPFDLGSVTGFVRRTGGRLHAVSGICTHQGCRLTLDDANERLDCPCHRTAFTTDGAVLNHQLPTAPPPLPHLPVRESGDTVEILAPPS
jgi:nitrite reductase/ring-hydroxylating ferredoxin subunit